MMTCAHCELNTAGQHAANCPLNLPVGRVVFGGSDNQTQFFSKYCGPTQAEIDTLRTENAGLVVQRDVYKHYFMQFRKLIDAMQADDFDFGDYTDAVRAAMNAYRDNAE
jgi:hypothetical protein